MIRRAARLAVALAAVAALSGCVKVTSTNSFSPDNTVTQDSIIALAPDAASQLGIDLDELTADALLDVEGGVIPGVDPGKIMVEDYAEGDLRGVHIVASDLTLDEFNDASAGAISSFTGGLGATLTVTREGDTYIVTIPADPARDVSQVQGAGSLGLLGDSIEVAVTLEFPGPVKSASAGQVDGKKVVLGLEDLLTADEIVIEAQATPGIAWEPILRWGGIVALAVVIFGGAALLIWQDKRKSARSPLPPPGEAPAADAVPGETAPGEAPPAAPLT